MVSLTFPPTKFCGSGKFGSPLERMQRENASSPFCVVVVAVVVEEAPLATLGEPPPPQPAASSEDAATATTDSVDECWAATHAVRSFQFEPGMVIRFGALRLGTAGGANGGQKAGDGADEDGGGEAAGPSGGGDGGSQCLRSA